MSQKAESQKDAGCSHSIRSYWIFSAEVKRMMAQLGRLRDIQRVNAQVSWVWVGMGGYGWVWSVVDCIDTLRGKF